MSYSEYKDKKFMHRGEEAGQTDENFYITGDNDVTYELSAAVYYIWKMLDGTKTLSEVVDQASKELNMSVNELQEPITMIVLKLLENNLIVEAK